MKREQWVQLPLEPAAPWFALRYADRALGADMFRVFGNDEVIDVPITAVPDVICRRLAVDGRDRPTVRRAIERLVEHGLLVADAGRTRLLYSQRSHRAWVSRSNGERPVNDRPTSGERTANGQPSSGERPTNGQSSSGEAGSSARNDSKQPGIDREREREEERDRESASAPPAPSEPANDQRPPIRPEPFESDPWTAERAALDFRAAFLERYGTEPSMGGKSVAGLAERVATTAQRRGLEPRALFAEVLRKWLLKPRTDVERRAPYACFAQAWGELTMPAEAGRDVSRGYVPSRDEDAYDAARAASAEPASEPAVDGEDVPWAK